MLEAVPSTRGCFQYFFIPQMQMIVKVKSYRRLQNEKILVKICFLVKDVILCQC